MRVKPGKDETGADKDQPIEGSVSISRLYSIASVVMHSQINFEVDLCFLPGKYTTDNWEKGGGATITPLSGSPYVVSNPSDVAGMCTSSYVDQLQSSHLKPYFLCTPESERSVAFRSGP